MSILGKQVWDNQYKKKSIKITLTFSFYAHLSDKLATDVVTCLGNH